MRPSSSFPFVSGGDSLLPQASGVTWNPANENTVGRPDVPGHFRRPRLATGCGCDSGQKASNPRGLGTESSTQETTFSDSAGKAARVSQLVSFSLAGFRGLQTHGAVWLMRLQISTGRHAAPVGAQTVPLSCQLTHEFR